MELKQKYLKYKNKYLLLKNNSIKNKNFIIGGTYTTSESEDNKSTNLITIPISLPTFIETK